MDDATRKRISQNLMRACATPADDLAAKVGEANPLVQIKRNHARLGECDRHEFQPLPDWRERKGPFSWLKVRCARCDGEMNASDVMTYLRGFAHGTGQDFKGLADAVFPPGAGA